MSRRGPVTTEQPRQHLITESVGNWRAAPLTVNLFPLTVVFVLIGQLGLAVLIANRPPAFYLSPIGTSPALALQAGQLGLPSVESSVAYCD